MKLPKKYSLRKAFDGQRIWAVEGLSSLDAEWHPLLYVMQEPAVFFNRAAAREWFKENKLALMGMGGEHPLYVRFRTVSFGRL